MSIRRQIRFFLATLTLAFVFTGCKEGVGKPKEYMYVSVPQVALRDRVATVYNKVGTVKNGERVEILERQKKFMRVRSTSGQEGWMEQRYLVNQEVMDEIAKLTRDSATRPVQGRATTRNETNLHVTPGRDTEHVYQLAEGAKVDLLERSTVAKPGAPAPPAKAKGAKEEEPKPEPVLEDWWLVRDPQHHTGWVLGRMLDSDVPLEIAQYAEGQRIVAYFVLNEVQDGDKKAPQYLVALTETKDGLPFDFNQVRVFTRNQKRHRYETAYRERNLFGLLPITTGTEDFEKEGRLPTFTIRFKDENGSVAQRKYKLNGPIVRQLLAPGEQKVKSMRPASARPESKKRNKKSH